MKTDEDLLTEDLLRASLHGRAAELKPSARALPAASRRPSGVALVGVGVGVVVLAAASGVIGVMAGHGTRTAPALTATAGAPSKAPTESTAGAPTDDRAKRDLETEPVTAHDGYLFPGKTVFGTVIDTGESATRYGVTGTVIYYLTSKQEGSPTPNVEYGIAETGTKRVLSDGGYGSDASEAKPGLHYAFRGPGDDVVAVLKGSGTVTTDGGPATIRSFDYNGLSLVLAHGNITRFTLAGGSDAVQVAG